MQLPELPPETMRTLAEKFFSHFHLGTLLLHKETFLLDLAAGRVPSMLSFAVAAVSAKCALYNPSNNRYCDTLEQDLVPRNRGQQWGERATLLALQHVDRPDLATAQTITLLSLFWFIAGQVSRADIHSGIASRLVQGLLLHCAHNSKEDWFDQEMKTRVFWAAYQVELFATLKPGYIHPLVNHCITVPLPRSEEEYASKKRKSNKSFQLEKDNGSDSIFGELMQVNHYW
jgi:Fungal specific transcription factor domain